MRLSGSRSTATLFSVLLLAGIYTTLNAPLAFYRWAPFGEWSLAFVPVVESIVLLWLICLRVLYLRSRQGRRWSALTLGALFGILCGLSVAEGFFRYYYARSFAPRGDIAMIRGGLLLLLGEIGSIVDLLAPLVFALILLTLAVIGWVCVLGVSALVARLRPFIALATVSGAAVVLIVPVGMPQSVTALTARSWLTERTIEFVEIPSVAAADPEAPPADAPTYRFPGLRDRDIYVFVVEAYGYASIYREELAEFIDPYRDRFEEALRRNGYEVMTNYLGSPVAGGYSWLADATFLTGQWIDTQEKFLQLYDAGFPTLSGTLHEGGYYTLTVRPGTVHAKWPEGWELYRFEESIIAYGGGFGFKGPAFSYVRVTDQFALWTAHQRIQERTGNGGPAAERPLFAYYQLVSSHTPFNAIPPFIENWEDLGDGSIYHERAAEIRRFNNTWSGGTQLIEGYVAAISYVFTSLTDYVDRIMDHSRDPIIIVFGDHEPQRPIRSTVSERAVPIHVAARDTDILACFEAAGYEAGMRASRVPPFDPMSSFFPTLIELARSCH